MARFEIDPTKPTPITPDKHTVDVGETVVWDVVAGAGIVEFAEAPDPVHFMKKDAQPGSPAIAIATHKGAKRDFDVVLTVAPGGESGHAASSSPSGSGIASLRARIIIR